MAAPLPSFSFTNRTNEADVASRFADLRKKLEAAKETFVDHQADGFVRTSPQSQSTVLEGLKTPEGRVTGVYRQGQDGSEDLEVVTSREQKSGSLGYMESRQITLHRDEHNPKLLTMTETDFFGHQLKFDVNEETGSVTASAARVQAPDGFQDLQPFNALQPKTLNDAEGVAAMSRLQEKLEGAQSALLSNQVAGRVMETEEDRSVVVANVKTGDGLLTGVLRQGVDGSLDMEAEIAKSHSDGSMGWTEATVLSQRRDSANPGVLLMTESNSFGTLKGFEFNETTGEAVPIKKRIQPDEKFNTNVPFNYLHPKTLTDAQGSIDLLKVESQAQSLLEILMSAPEGADKVQTSQGWVTGHYQAESGTLDARSSQTVSDGSHSWAEGKHVMVERNGSNTTFTSADLQGFGKRYVVNQSTGEVSRTRYIDES
jgi:hypothetical protein